MIYLNYAGYGHAAEAIAHGKISHKPFEFKDTDERELLGPDGTDLDAHSLHHLGLDTDQPTASPRKHRYPLGKGGVVYSRALHGIRNLAHDSGHETIRDVASKLLGDIKLRTDPSERDADLEPERRHIVKDGGKYLLYTKDGHKLIAKHDTLEGAEEQEAAIKAHEADEGKARSMTPTPAPRPAADGGERRCYLRGIELRASGDGKGPGIVHGYAAVFDRWSEDLGGFRERILPGAFAGVMGTDVRALANHDPSQLLGRCAAGTLRMREDNVGLRVEIDLPDTQVGRDIATSIRRGDMDGMSFAFTLDAEDSIWDFATDPATRTIKVVRGLYDVGPVTYAAYPDTSCAVRDLERARAAIVPDLRSLSIARARQRLAEAQLLPVP